MNKDSIQSKMNINKSQASFNVTGKFYHVTNYLNKTSLNLLEFLLHYPMLQKYQKDFRKKGNVF